MSFAPGSRLGVYEITGLIGAGGMGEVHRARDPRLGRDVAIKVLPAAFSADPERLHRFEQEARATARSITRIFSRVRLGTHAAHLYRVGAGKARRARTLTARCRWQSNRLRDSMRRASRPRTARHRPP